LWLHVVAIPIELLLANQPNYNIKTLENGVGAYDRQFDGIEPRQGQ